jgi:uncharacterized membrane protein YfhO
VREHRSRPEQISVDTRGERGTLVVAESWDPGWSARVDGRARALFIADRNSLAVQVGTGDHRVELRYRTPGLRLRLLISTVSAMALALLTLLPWFRRSASRG